jgi:hypothetical protein
VFLRSVSLLILASLSIVLATRANAPRPAYACTGGPGPFQEYAAYADAVAVVVAESVGGPDNSAPPITPSAAVPAATPGPPLFDLTSLGAHLRVVQTVAGDLPVEFDVDAYTRETTEQQIRLREADPNIISSCPLGFGINRYEAGTQYFLFLSFEEGLGWSTIIKFKMDGSNLLTGDFSSVDNPSLVVSDAEGQAYFAGMLATELPATEASPRSWQIRNTAVPGEAMIAAVLGVRSGSVPGDQAVEPQASVDIGEIRPPNAGDAGLR